MLTADRIGALPPTRPEKALPPNALLLNCFGRGGSSEKLRIRLDEAPDLIAPDVNTRAVARLDHSERQRIGQATAELFGYGADNF
ncbi:hypothetical protein [Mesorhizobium mediterraneum]|uniref:hypothetical protein n=1 Tax=Mesorhizobium mediterraneum TaxID=43617 RepID=UPI00177A7740|nr:hypothetical protein [Mesorhizobium mediterraneum]